MKKQLKGAGAFVETKACSLQVLVLPHPHHMIGVNYLITFVLRIYTQWIDGVKEKKTRGLMECGRVVW